VLHVSVHCMIVLIILFRTMETIVDYCKERLDHCESTVERDEINMNQLTPSGSTPEAVHEQVVLLKVRLEFQLDMCLLN
jgi:hypothetical protein